MRSSWRLHLVMLCVTIIFGLNGPLTKALLGEGLSPYTHMFCRFLGATILFWAASLWLPREHIERKDWGKMILAALTGILFNQGLFAIGMSMTSPVNQSLISTLGPIVTMLLAALVLKEPITRLKGFGVLTGAIGVLLLVSTNGRATVGSTLGDIICAAATISYSIYLTFFKSIIRKYHPITLMKWLFLITLICIGPIGMPCMIQTEWGSFDVTFYSQLAFVVFGATFTAYILLPVAQRGLRPTVISIYNYGTPVIAPLVAIMMGQERLTPIKILSAVLILLGVFMVTRSKSRRQQLREQQESLQEGVD